MKPIHTYTDPHINRLPIKLRRPAWFVVSILFFWLRYLSFETRWDWDGIDDIQIAGIDWSDYPDFCDSFIEEAYWATSGVALTEDELDYLNDNYREFVFEQTENHIY